jgi:hypothetical protein
MGARLTNPDTNVIADQCICSSKPRCGSSTIRTEVLYSSTRRFAEIGAGVGIGPKCVLLPEGEKKRLLT